VLPLGRALHCYETPAHRLDDGLVECCWRLGISAEVFTTLTPINVSFGDRLRALDHQRGRAAAPEPVAKLAASLPPSYRLLPSGRRSSRRRRQ
jgi:hypothetical protein